MCEVIGSFSSAVGVLAHGGVTPGDEWRERIPEGSSPLLLDVSALGFVCAGARRQWVGKSSSLGFGELKVLPSGCYCTVEVVSE